MTVVHVLASLMEFLLQLVVDLELFKIIMEMMLVVDVLVINLGLILIIFTMMKTWMA